MAGIYTDVPPTSHLLPGTLPEYLPNLTVDGEFVIYVHRLCTYV